MIVDISLKAEVANLGTLTEMLEFILKQAQCPERVSNKISVAVDELFGNIAYYAYGGKSGDATVRIEIPDEQTYAELTFIDKGIAFDPTKHKDPDITASAEEREIGGQGINIVKRIMDEVSYKYVDGQNMLTIKKNFK